VGQFGKEFGWVSGCDVCVGRVSEGGSEGC